jgi:ribosomal protein S18 acetylase RimI-like enzyme
MLKSERTPITLEAISPANAPLFRQVRLRALEQDPSAFGSTFAKESQLDEAAWQKRAAAWTGDRSTGVLALEPIPGDSALPHPCGLIGAFLDELDPPRAHVISLWVDAEHRRLGLGRRLLDAVKSWAARHGARELRLLVTSGNHSAIDFYHRNGFSMTGHIEPYPNDPTVIEFEMRCLLPPEC